MDQNLLVQSTRNVGTIQLWSSELVGYLLNECSVHFESQLGQQFMNEVQTTLR